MRIHAVATLFEVTLIKLKNIRAQGRRTEWNKRTTGECALRAFAVKKRKSKKGERV